MVYQSVTDPLEQHFWCFWVFPFPRLVAQPNRESSNDPFPYIYIYIYIYIYGVVRGGSHHIYIYIYIYISWPTVAEGDPKAPFSMANTPMRWGRRHFFSLITPLTLDPYLIMLSVKQGGIKFHFFFFFFF